MALRKLLFDAHPQQYALEHYAGLRPPEEWAASNLASVGSNLAAGKVLGSGGGKAERAEGMLRHAAEPIHRSLLRHDSPGLAKEATRQFKNLLAFCGERKAAQPESSAAEWLRAGVEEPSLRGEMYVQLLKQLSVPLAAGGRATQRCWHLLAASLAHFPPPQPLENVVGCFIHTQAAPGERGTYEALAPRASRSSTA